MDLKIDTHIRTEHGIAKIVNELHDQFWLDRKVMFNYSNGELENIIVKDSSFSLQQIQYASDDIVEVIKTDDYVNGHRIRYIEKGVLYITGDVIYKHEIKDIMTKEVFNKEKYKVNIDE